MLTDCLGRSGLAVTQNRDRSRRRKISHREDFVAQERVDEGALATIILADDDEKKQLVHLVDESSEALEVGASTVGLRQRISHAEHEPPLERDELPLLSGENLFQTQSRLWIPRTHAWAALPISSRTSESLRPEDLRTWNE